MRTVRKPVSSTLRKIPKPRAKPKATAVWPPPLSEKQLQAQCFEALRLLGWDLLDTSRRPARICKFCRKWSAEGDGVTTGCPDFFFRRSDWEQGRWIAIELKTAKGKVRDEQKVLNEAGGSYICRSLEDVLEVASEAKGRGG